MFAIVGGFMVAGSFYWLHASGGYLGLHLFGFVLGGWPVADRNAKADTSTTLDPDRPTIRSLIRRPRVRCGGSAGWVSGCPPRLGSSILLDAELRLNG